MAKEVSYMETVPKVNKEASALTFVLSDTFLGFLLH